MAHHLDRPPMACSEPPPVHSDDEFRDLLLAVSYKMSEDDPNNLAFAAKCNLPGPGKPAALSVLNKMRKEGVFSPYSCCKLEELLRRIQRHDLADLVRAYADSHPGPPPGRRHTSPVENGGSASGVLLKRSAADPPPVIRRQLSPASDVMLVGIGGHGRREQTGEDDPEVPTAPTELGTVSFGGCVSQETSPDHRQFSSLAIGTHSTPAHSHLHYSSTEPLNMTSPTQGANFSFDQSTPAHVSYGPTSDPSYQESQETHSQPTSRSATVSRESSFRSLSSISQQSRASLKDKASQMAHLAIDVMAHVSREELWYRSDSSFSLSSVSSSARHTHSDTASLHSEGGDHGMMWRNKKHSQSLPSNHSTQHPQRRRKRSPSVPVCRHNDTGNHVTYPSPRSPPAEDTDSHIKLRSGDEDAVCGKCDDLTPTRGVTLRQKKRLLKREGPETQRQSIISDATPRQSMNIDNTIHPRHSVISDATLTTRSSVISDSSLSMPTSPVYSRESQDVAEATGDDHEMLKPNSPFPKEKSLLRRKFSFLRSKSRTSSPPSFTWKVGREELMKPVWGHKYQSHITRPGKFELDMNLAKLNPKLTFQLYPNGLDQDKDNAVTMVVRIVTHDKCPPLPPSSMVHLKLVVWSGEDKEMKREPAIKEKLNQSWFCVNSVITHHQLKDCYCKYFYLELELSCSGLQRESLV